MAWDFKMLDYFVRRTAVFGLLLLVAQQADAQLEIEITEYPLKYWRQRAGEYAAFMDVLAELAHEPQGINVRDALLLLLVDHQEFGLPVLDLPWRGNR